MVTTSPSTVTLVVDAMHQSLVARVAPFCVRKEGIVSILCIPETYFTGWHDFNLPDGGPAIHINLIEGEGRTFVLLEDMDILKRILEEVRKDIALLEEEEVVA